jgi:hypothetical protein
VAKASCDLQVLTEVSGTADYMVTTGDGESVQIVGWVYVTENDEFDARRANMLPLGTFPTLERATEAIGQAAE